MDSICLFGAGGHGKVIKEIADSIGVSVITYIDDAPKCNYLHEIPVESSDKIAKFISKSFIISIGNNNLRKKIVDSINCNFSVLVHSSTIISASVSIAMGSVVMAGVIINSDTVIGEHVIVNTGAVIEHDCILDNFVHISPNATIAGNVTVREGAHIGAAAVIIPSINIGKWSIIGAGAVIINDVPDYAVVVGNPGKIRN